MLGLQGHILHDIIVPTHVGETDRIATALELLQNLIREHRRKGFARREVEVVTLHLIKEGTILIRVGQFKHLGWRKG